MRHLKRSVAQIRRAQSPHTGDAPELPGLYINLMKWATFKSEKSEAGRCGRRGRGRTILLSQAPTISLSRKAFLAALPPWQLLNITKVRRVLSASRLTTPANSLSSCSPYEYW